MKEVVKTRNRFNALEAELIKSEGKVRKYISPLGDGNINSYSPSYIIFIKLENTYLR